MDIPILFEDASLLVIDKPVGISVEETGQDETDTIKQWVKTRYNLTDSKDRIQNEFEQRFGIVHRLDKETSGVLLIAKNESAFDYLKGLFKFRRIKKEYQALVYGMIIDIRFEISAPIARNKRDGTSYTIDSRGRESATEFTVVGRTDLYTYLKIFPKTGRTHQIRIHLKAFGHPIVNDKKYASKRLLDLSEGLQGRMMLHAKSISFIDWDGMNRCYSSPRDLSEYFQDQVFTKNL